MEATMTKQAQWFAQWCVGESNAAFVFIPGVAKPINVGSRQRAAHIVRCVNAHDELVAALRESTSVLEDAHTTLCMGKLADDDDAAYRRRAIRKQLTANRAILAEVVQQ